MAGTAEPKDPAPNAASSDDWYGLREGEVAVALPNAFDASLYYIGRIHTPWKRREDCPKNPRESDAVCTVELDPRWLTSTVIDLARVKNVAQDLRFEYCGLGAVTGRG